MSRRQSPASSHSPTSLWSKVFGKPKQKPIRRNADVRRELLNLEPLEERLVLTGNNFLVGQQTALLADVNQYLTDVENTINIQVFHQKIPVIGNALAQVTGATFVEQVRQQLNTTLTQDFTSGAVTESAAEADVQEALFDALGPTGLNVLQDPNGNAPSLNDVTVVSDANHVQFNASLLQTQAQITAPINFQAGFSSLGLSVNGNVGITVTTAFQIGFGFDSTGFYGDTAAGKNGTAQDLVITAQAGLSGLTATGKLGIFQIDVTDNSANPTAITLTATAGLTNSAGDDKFRLADSTGLQFDQLQLAASGNVSLPMILSIEGSDAIPRLEATLDFSLGVTETITPGTPLTQDITPASFSLDNVGINLGSFITNFLRPATQFLDKPLNAINFLINDETKDVSGSDLGFFFAPIPILSGVPFANSMTPLQLLGYLENVPEVGPVVTGFVDVIEALAKLNDFVRAVDNSSGGNNIWINLGSFQIHMPGSGGSGSKPIGDTGISADQTATAQDGDDQVNADSGSEDAGGQKIISQLFGPPQLSGPQFSFPILTDPFTAINLLLGNYANVDLFKFTFIDSVTINGDIPGGIQNIVDKLLSSAPQDVQDGVNAFLSLLPVQINYDILFKNLGFNINLGAGFNASGIAQFVNSHDPADILKGFFIQSGTLLSVGGCIGLTAGVKVVDPVSGSTVFEAHGSGSVTTQIDVGLNDPNNDGMLTLSEIEAILGSNISNLGRLFYVDGSMAYSVDAGFSFPIANYFPDDYSSSGTIFDFSYGGGIGQISSTGEATNPNTGVVTTTIDPTLATLNDDGTLYLNIGPKAGDRVFDDISDDSEDFTVSHVGGTAGNETVTVTNVVTGLTQTFQGVQCIVGDAGAGSNTIAAVNILDPMAFSAGAGGVVGNDTNVIDVSTCSGPATINVVGSGPTTVHGGNGPDTITVAGTSATITDGNGTDTINAADSAIITVGGGNDTITGGNSITVNGNGNDTITGGSSITINGNGNDTIRAAGNHFDTITITGSGNDVIYGGDSGNVILAGDGNTTVYGGAGNDTITGGAGDDVLHGGGGADTITSDALGIAQIYGDTGHDTIIAHQYDTWVQGGSGGNNAVTIDATGVADNASLTASSFNSVIGGVAYSTRLINVQSLTVNLGGVSTLDLNGYAGPLTVNTSGTQPDTITVANLPASVGTVAFNLNDIANAVIVENTQAPLNLIGGAGSNTLDINRSSDLANETGTISASLVTGLGIANVGYSGLNAVTVELGHGRNSLTVSGTINNGTTTLNGGPDNDSFRVTGVGNGGGGTIINGNGGTDTVVLVSAPDAGHLQFPCA